MCRYTGMPLSVRPGRENRATVIGKTIDPTPGLTTVPHPPTTVLIIGAYGFFGRRLCALLARNPALRIVIAGRRQRAAEIYADELRVQYPQAAISSIVTDTEPAHLTAAIVETGAAIVVNLSGPFQHQNYTVAQTCIQQGVHYTDLADGRAFVTGIVELDASARAANVLVATGASSVPALSCAAIDHLATQFTRIDTIDIGISPGNKTDRGLATIAAILSYCGEPIEVRRAGRPQTQRGWMQHARHTYPAPVGKRWLTLCDVPDLTLLPQRFPDVSTVRFRAGLELPLLHLGLGFLSLLRSLHLLPNLATFAAPLKRASEWFIGLGSDAGAMHVELTGIDLSGTRQRLRWTLLAERGDGPFVPTLAAAALVAKLASQSHRSGVPMTGATPCIGLLSLDDILAQSTGLAIRTTTTVDQP